MFEVNPLLTIQMKNQALFSSKDVSKKIKCGLLQILFSALRVNLKARCFSCCLRMVQYAKNVAQP